MSTRSRPSARRPGTSKVALLATPAALWLTAPCAPAPLDYRPTADVTPSTDGTWSSPAFYTLAAGSFGLQFGGQVSEVVFTLMTEGAVQALLANEVKLGVDASIAIGPFGLGLEASTTTNLDADIYAFAKTVGLFGGGSLEGAKLFSRDSWNDTYYGASASPRAVVIERAFFNPQAEQLRSAVP